VNAQRNTPPTLIKKNNKKVAKKKYKGDLYYVIKRERK
jgi:hypothetical protein